MDLGGMPGLSPRSYSGFGLWCPHVGLGGLQRFRVLGF